MYIYYVYILYIIYILLYYVFYSRAIKQSRHVMKYTKSKEATLIYIFPL